MEKTSSKLIILFIYIYLVFLIVGGNTLTFNIAGRVSIKVSEIISIFLGLIFIKRFFATKWPKAVQIIIIWAILSILLIVLSFFKYNFALSDVATAFLYLFRFIYAILLSFIIFSYIKEQRLTVKLLQFINTLYLIICFIGFIQLIFYPLAFDFYSIFWSIGVYFPNADYHINRIVSTYFDPNYFASCLLIGVTIDLYLLNRKRGIRDKKHDKLIYYFIFIIYVITILLTKSRSGFLGLGCIVVFTIFLNADYKHLKIWQVFLFLIGCLVFIFLLLFSNITVFVRIRNVFNDASASARFLSWRKGFQIIKDTNYIGMGYNIFGAYNKMFYGIEFESSGYGNDSSLLLILMTTGIIGFIIFIYHLIKLIKPATVRCPVTPLIITACLICNFNNLLFYSLWVSAFYLVVFIIQNDYKSVRSKQFENTNY